MLGPRLGTGGPAVVDRARQLLLHRDVALKRPVRRDDPAYAELLLREAVITAQIDHPNVVAVHTIGQDDDGSPVIVLREVRGRSLAEVLHHGPDGTDTLRWHATTLIAVCHALEAAHERGFVHGDVKPHNVFVGDRGETWLLVLLVVVVGELALGDRIRLWVGGTA